MSADDPIPITIVTGFLGSGKTTLILKLIAQLPADYRLALIKNEFGDVAVDSQLATQQAISGVRELLNGCICCNLVGSLGDALEQLRTEQRPDRIMIETSGSAFPATLAMEVNRLGRATGRYVLDGVISVIDVENWKGYEDTSVTAKLQAQYTDLLVLNKWELVEERQLEDCVDRILDLELDVPTPMVQSEKGRVDRDVLLGLDAKLARSDGLLMEGAEGHAHEHNHQHSSEVEVLSVSLSSKNAADVVDNEKLVALLTSAPKDEVYRIKGIIASSSPLKCSTGEEAVSSSEDGRPGRYILNWAFGRWTFTGVQLGNEESQIVRLTLVTARGESMKWKRRLEKGDLIAAQSKPGEAALQVTSIT